MLAHELRVGAVDAAREILDRFGVPSRLRHIGDYIWRGGSLRLELIEEQAERLPGVCYELKADWPAPLFVPLPGPQPALERAHHPVLEGRWTRGRAGYVLRVGIDLGAPWALFVRTDRPLSDIPFLHRPHSAVENALAADLSAYVDWFLGSREPVPQATSAAAQRLREYGLSF